MRLIFTTTLFCFSIILFGQNIDSCGADNNPKLTLQESNYLNNYLKDSRDTFDFIGKQVVFVTSSTGNRIGTKIEYFNEIRNWTFQYKDSIEMPERNKKIATSFIILTEKEKTESGGYDAILTYWVKFITTGQKNKIIRTLKHHR